jgi:hypothetical protein
MGAPRSDGAHTPACWSCPVIALKIHHKTVYRFRQQVSLWAHRLILRPRESRDLCSAVIYAMSSILLTRR